MNRTGIPSPPRLECRVRFGHRRHAAAVGPMWFRHSISQMIYEKCPSRDARRLGRPDGGQMPTLDWGGILTVEVHRFSPRYEGHPDASVTLLTLSTFVNGQVAPLVCYSFHESDYLTH
jgi:hypothetical protein